MNVSPRITGIYDDVVFAKRGCLYWIPGLRSDHSSRNRSWERIPRDHHGCGFPWWNRSCKKLRKWSERIAGPKWKTFIRRFNKKNKRSGYKRFGKNKFNNYDLASYSLNFDEGPRRSSNLDDEYYLYRGFSSRYAAIPATAKSSMPSLSFT